MSFIDSHCHLDFGQLAGCFSEILSNARRNNVIEFVVPSISIENIPKVIKLAGDHEFIHMALGLHPCFMDLHLASHIDQLDQLVELNRPIAIGEIGLDFYISVDQQQQQKQLMLFAEQLQLAQRYDLPVILHVRKAHDQVLALLKKHKFYTAGIVHAFNGSFVQAKRYTDEFGFKLGFGGAITHSRALKLRALVSQLPLTDIVLETDAPDMPIANMQQAYNQPANIKQISEVVFELRSEPAIEIERQIESNTRQILGLITSSNG
ncbi:MAG: hypothetical protein OFPII_16230 [Osedax symbiont Rs1]|nr:MAG: hypothetical protein OFPII_16230 [Osedax symbiont Rs1]